MFQGSDERRGHADAVDGEHRLSGGGDLSGSFGLMNRLRRSAISQGVWAGCQLTERPGQSVDRDALNGSDRREKRPLVLVWFERLDVEEDGGALGTTCSLKRQRDEVPERA